jgi:hypothetical protein
VPFGARFSLHFDGFLGGPLCRFLVRCLGRKAPRMMTGKVLCAGGSGALSIPGNAQYVATSFARPKEIAQLHYAPHHLPHYVRWWSGNMFTSRTPR